MMGRHFFKLAKFRVTAWRWKAVHRLILKRASLDERGHGHQFRDAGQFGVGLLHGHDDLDMLNVIHEGTEAHLPKVVFSPVGCSGEAIEVGGQLPAFFILGE